MRNKPVSTSHHKEWDRYVSSLTGGLTVLKPARGQWVHNNELHEERVIPVRVACTTDEIDKIIDFTLNHYSQITVMAYKLSDLVIMRRKNGF
jgi:hypothetical protein